MKVNTHSPPNSCIPSSANIKINKKSKNRRLMIERIEFNKEMTRFLSEAQYLVTLKMREFIDNPQLVKSLRKPDHCRDWLLTPANALRWMALMLGEGGAATVLLGDWGSPGREGVDTEHPPISTVSPP